MENKNNKNQKADNKYVLLEKPMFFNSKLINQEKNINNEQKSYKDINNNTSTP